MIAVTAVCGLSACSSPVVAVQNLEALHVSPVVETTASGFASPQRATYSETVPHRGRVRRFRDNIVALFIPGRPELVERRIEDPVGFAAYQMKVLRTTTDLEPLERVMATLVLCQYGRDDPSRALRVEAFRCLGQWPRTWDVELDWSQNDEDERIESVVAKMVEHVLPGSRGENVNVEDCEAVVREFAALRPSRVTVADRLARLALLAARDPVTPSVGPALFEAAYRHTERTLVMSLGHGMMDPDEFVQSEAGGAMARSAPFETIAFLHAQRELFAPLVTIRSYTELAKHSELTVEKFPAGLRGELVDALLARDAAMAHAAAKLAANLLDLSPETPVELLADRLRATGVGGTDPTG